MINKTREVQGYVEISNIIIYKTIGQVSLLQTLVFIDLLFYLYTALIWHNNHKDTMLPTKHIHPIPSF